MTAHPFPFTASEPSALTFAWAEQSPASAYAEYCRLRAATRLQRHQFIARIDEDDGFDAGSKILLAMAAGRCCGGIRATIRRRSVDPLPMESAGRGLALRSIFPGMRLDGVPHAELSGLVLPDGSGGIAAGEVLRGLLYQMLAADRPEPGLRWVFVMGPSDIIRPVMHETIRMRLPQDVRAVPEHCLPQSMRGCQPVQILACPLVAIRPERPVSAPVRPAAILPAGFTVQPAW